MFLICFSLDPCENKPCKGKNTVCTSTSSSEFKCLCEENYFPVNENAKLNGCQKNGNTPHEKCSNETTKVCGPNSDLLVTGKCRCYQDYFEEAKGDADSSKGCQSTLKLYFLFNFIIA